MPQSEKTIDNQGAVEGSAKGATGGAATGAATTNFTGLFREAALAETKWDLARGFNFQNSPTAQMTPEIRVVNEGDPQIGTVVLVRQIHWTPEAEADEILRKRAGWCQDAMLHYFLKEKPGVVFVEGMTRNTTSLQMPKDRTAYHLREFVTSASVNSPYHSWYDTIALENAVDIYQSLSSKVSFRATTNDFIEGLAPLIDQYCPPFIKNFYTLNVRESVASGYVNHYLEQHPGTIVHVAYGADHAGLVDNFGGARVVTVEWPAISNQASFEGEQEIIKATGSRQAQLADRTWLLSDLVWQHLDSAETQNKNFHKIRTEASVWDFNAEKFRQHLKDLALSSETRAMIDTEFARFARCVNRDVFKYEGVFEAFTPQRMGS